MADCLGVSRTHIRNLFVKAEAAGYVRLSGRDRPMEIQPPLSETYDRFVADVEVDQDAIAQIALAEHLLAACRLKVLACISLGGRAGQ
jgi:DNA-binding GntR family transcriptional regulator